MGIDPYPESVILGQMWDVGESEGDCDEGRGEASGTQFSASQLAARRALFSECQVCLVVPLVPLALSLISLQFFFHFVPVSPFDLPFYRYLCFLPSLFSLSGTQSFVWDCAV